MPLRVTTAHGVVAQLSGAGSAGFDTCVLLRSVVTCRRRPWLERPFGASVPWAGGASAAVCWRPESPARRVGYQSQYTRYRTSTRS
jgi:hypothetical protein